VKVGRDDVRERGRRAAKSDADVSELPLKHVARRNGVRALHGDTTAVVLNDLGRRSAHDRDDPEDERDEHGGELQRKVGGRDTPEVDAPPLQERPGRRGNTRHG